MFHCVNCEAKDNLNAMLSLATCVSSGARRSNSFSVSVLCSDSISIAPSFSPLCKSSPAYLSSLSKASHSFEPLSKLSFESGHRLPKGLRTSMGLKNVENFRSASRSSRDGASQRELGSPTPSGEGSMFGNMSLLKEDVNSNTKSGLENNDDKTDIDTAKEPVVSTKFNVELARVVLERPEFKFMGVRVVDVWETLVLISPFFFWGTAMVCMKPVVPKAGPLFVAAFRLLPAGVMLVGYALATGKKLPKGAMAWVSISLFAVVDASCFQGFLAEGLKRTSAGLGSVIIDSQPLTVAILSSLLFKERLGPVGLLGLAVGIGGLLLLEVPMEVLKGFLSFGRISDLDNIFGPVSTQLSGRNFDIWETGEWWMLLAAQSMAIGTVMSRWVCQYSDPIMATGWHMILGGFPLIVLSIMQQDPAVSGHFQDLQAYDFLALLYTSVAGSAISYGVFFLLAQKGNLTRFSSLTFLTPLFAALFGYIILGETLTTWQLVGAGMTLGSISLLNFKSAPMQDIETKSNGQD